MNIKDMNKTMFGYFTELTTFLRDTTGLVVSYVKGLLFGDPFITETPVHIQEDNETPVHIQEDNETPVHIQPIVTVTETTSALDGAVRSYVVEVDRPTDPITFMRLVKPKVLGEIFRRETKVYMGLECAMEKIGVGDEAEDTYVSHFRTKCDRLLDESEYEEFYDGMVDTILLHFAEYQKRGSGWRLDHIRHLNVKVSLNKPLKGGSHIPLPKKLRNKGAIINMKNKDDMCFKWAVTRALNPVDRDSERVTKKLRKQSEQYNWEGVDFPITLKDIKTFEKNNNIFVNVFGFDEDNGKSYVYPRYNPKGDCMGRVRLMLITEGVGDHVRSHYTVVKCMSRLLQRQSTKNRCKRFYCDNCLNGFTSEEVLRDHEIYCGGGDCVRSEYPKEGEYVSFKSYSKTVKHPFVIYADFECFTTPVETVNNNSNKAYTAKYQKHEPSGFCYYVKCSEEGVYDKEPVLFTKENEHDDVSKRFVKCLEGTLKEIVELYDNPKSMKFGESDREMHNLSTRCHVCQHDLTVNGELDKVKDHCHLTGRYRGAAHSKCNLAIRNPKFIPVVFHNLEGYDSHLFIKNLGVSEGWIRCIPKTDEKYISFTKSVVVGEYIDKDGEVRTRKGSLRFIDSIKFMSAGLGNLVSNLEEDRFRCISKFYGGERLSLLLRKGVYPYDYMSELTKLNDTCLPVIKGFYNRLNDEDISTEDYNHAQNVWDHFGCKTMRDYHDLYLKSDVLLLADVFETFRDLCMLNY